jgi:hypothetical protein
LIHQQEARRNRKDAGKEVRDKETPPEEGERSLEASGEKAFLLVLE